jgi:hypothetical protein
MQRPHGFLVDLWPSPTAPFKDADRAIQEGLLPLMHHRRMHTVFGGQLRNRALALHGFQRHAGLEPHVMVPAFLHVLISSLLETSRRQIVAYVTVPFSGNSSMSLGGGHIISATLSQQ